MPTATRRLLPLLLAVAATTVVLPAVPATASATTTWVRILTAPGSGTTGGTGGTGGTTTGTTTSARSAIQTESFAAFTAVTVAPATGATGTAVSGLGNDDWLRYDRVDFGGTPPTTFSARAASGAGYGISGLEGAVDERQRLSRYASTPPPARSSAASPSRAPAAGRPGGTSPRTSRRSPGSTPST